MRIKSLTTCEAAVRSSNWLDIKDEPTLFESETEWQKEWKGMPEFVQGKQREYAKIIVRFRNEGDLQEFAKLIGQKLNQQSKSIWHPALLRNKNTVTKYVSES